MLAPFSCPRCGAVSHHPMDALEGYCGACHDWTGPRQSGLPPGPRYYDREGQPMPMREWGERLDDPAYKHVAVTAVGADVEVSTVWLGINHRFIGQGPPVIFETMVFGGELDGYCERYTTLEAAEAGHERWVAEVRESAQARNGP